MLTEKKKYDGNSQLLEKLSEIKDLTVRNYCRNYHQFLMYQNNCNNYIDFIFYHWKICKNYPGCVVIFPWALCPAPLLDFQKHQNSGQFWQFLSFLILFWKFFKSPLLEIFSADVDDYLAEVFQWLKDPARRLRAD